MCVTSRDLFVILTNPPRRTDSLFNAVKKQHGLHSYLLRLSLPAPPPPPVPISALLPRLPPSHPPVSNNPSAQLARTNSEQLETQGLRMTEADLQSTARFTREFAVMSLIPWMEKCVLDWNDNVSASLPATVARLSRAFVSTLHPGVCRPGFSRLRVVCSALDLLQMPRPRYHPLHHHTHRPARRVRFRL